MLKSYGQEALEHLKPTALPLVLPLAAFSRIAHPNYLTLDTALPWVLSNTRTKSEALRFFCPQRIDTNELVLCAWNVCCWNSTLQGLILLTTPMDVHHSCVSIFPSSPRPQRLTTNSRLTFRHTNSELWWYTIILYYTHQLSTVGSGCYDLFMGNENKWRRRTADIGFCC